MAVGSGRGVGQGRAIVDLRSEAGPLASVLNRRSRWIEAFIVLGTVAVFFVVLGFLAAYFRDYFHLGLIFLLAWLLASLISPVADYLQHRLRHLPRVAAVLGITVPVILVGALIGARLVALLVESLEAWPPYCRASSPILRRSSLMHRRGFRTEAWPWISTRRTEPLAT